MVTLVKHEWHQVDAQFACELTADKLAEIYPDLDEAAIEQMLRDVEEGRISVEQVVSDAQDNSVDID